MPQGADVTLGEQYARERGLQLDASSGPDWNDNTAGLPVLIRNKEMAESADALIAFPQEGEESRGTMEHG
jgi:hypothetical protein